MVRRLVRPGRAVVVAAAVVVAVAVLTAPGPSAGATAIRGVPAELPPLEHDPDDVRDAADDVLARPEFAEQRGLLQRLFDWIGDRLADLFGDRQPNVPGGGFDLGALGTTLGWVLVVALLVVAALLVVRFVRFGRLGRRRRRPDEVEVEEDEPRSAADEVTGDADTLESDGRWREAMLVRYRGLVADLVGARVLQPIPGRTAGEYSAEVAGTVPAVAEPFDDATDLFERAWYGNLPTGPEESRRFREAAETVLEEARR